MSTFVRHWHAGKAIWQWLGATLLFQHISSVIQLGRKSFLRADDLPELPATLHPSQLSQLFSKLDCSGQLAFIRSLYGAVRAQLVLQMSLLVSMVICQLMLPVLLHSLLQKIELILQQQASVMAGTLLLVALALISTSHALLVQQYMYCTLNILQKLVSGLNCLIYDKALRLSKKAVQRRSLGDILNHMGPDSDILADSVWTIGELFYSLLLFLGVTFLLSYYLGLAAFFGLGIFLLAIPFMRRLTRRFLSLDQAILAERDRRISLISQIFNAMRVVKFFAWERRMIEEVNAIRKRELAIRRQHTKASSLASLIFMTARIGICFVSFAVYVLLGNQLDAPTVFACLTLFAALEGPFAGLSHHIAQIGRCRAAADRILQFMKAEEYESASTKAPSLSAGNEQLGVSLRAISASYDDAEKKVINNISLAIQPGECVAIVGPVASGKTSLLHVILGELQPLAGEVSFFAADSEHRPHPRFAYVAQEAFILNASLRENITLGQNIADIDRLLYLASLEEDVQALAYGLDTELGENGVNLSGGQKQRISLARAAASSANLILLDDPLSALDPRTEEQVLERLIFGEWQNRTRLVVTHRLKQLANFDRILYMEQGQILANGSYQELMLNSVAFQSFMASQQNAAVLKANSAKAQWEQNEAAQTKQEAIKTAKGAAFIQEEDRACGAVKKETYLSYFNAMAENTGGSSRLAKTLLICTVILCTALPVLQTSWLSYWIDGGIDPSSLGLSKLVNWNLLIYGLISLSLILASYIQNRYWGLRSVEAGHNLHQKALLGAMFTKISFFDTTPVGRIINRFSGDVDTVERDMAWAYKDMIYLGLLTLASVLTMLVVVPVMLLLLPALALAYFKLQADYRASSREVKRLTAISRSPRFASFKETLEGLLTLRAFERLDYCRENFMAALTNYQRIFHGMVCINRWFSVRVPLLGSTLLLGVGCGILLLAKWQWIGVGTAGLALLYARFFTSYMNEAVRAFSEAEARLTSVERLEYYGRLEPEQEEMPTGSKWQIKAGAIEFHKVSMRYAEHLEPALKDLSFQIPAASQVGILGKTGSGKSTLFQVLFRFFPLEQGQIFIDGQDISQLPLETLRSQIAIIPQDPTLFAGKLRDNLDRFGQFSDEEIWQALDRVHLSELLKSLPDGLHSQVTEGGSNFSQGQRQLICFARALLINAKIVVLDEATASVDAVTDRRIQQVLKHEMKGKTLLIIAHRLDTLSDCELLFHMEKARISYIEDRRDKGRKLG